MFSYLWLIDPLVVGVIFVVISLRWHGCALGRRMSMRGRDIVGDKGDLWCDGYLELHVRLAHDITTAYVLASEDACTPLFERPVALIRDLNSYVAKSRHLRVCFDLRDRELEQTQRIAIGLQCAPRMLQRSAVAVNLLRVARALLRAVKTKGQIGILEPSSCVAKREETRGCGCSLEVARRKRVVGELLCCSS